MLEFNNKFLIASLVCICSLFFLYNDELRALASGSDLLDKQEIQKIVKNKLSAENKKEVTKERLLVKFKNSDISLKSARGVNQARDIAKQYKLTKTKDDFKHNFSVYELDPDENIEDVITNLKARDDVAYAEIDYQFSPYAISSNDPLNDELWGLDNVGQELYRGAVGTIDADIDAPEAWQISTGTHPAIVAVIDSGVAYNHPDLANNMWDGSACSDWNGNFLGACQSGYDFAQDDKAPLPTDSAHGTHVAGTIAAGLNNGNGIIGVAPNADIMALATNLYLSEIISAISFAEHNGASVINASWGGSVFSQMLYDAIASSSALFVTAAGNSAVNNSLEPSYPCDYDLDNILCVASSDRNDDLSSFSNYSTDTVDLAAPGTNILSTVPWSLIYSEDFEGVVPPALPAGYTVSGTWATVANPDPNWGVVAYGDANRSPYTADNTAYLTSAAIDLSGLSTTTSAYFDYWISCDTEFASSSNDAFYFYFSANGTDFTYQDYWNEYYLNPESDSNGSAVYHFQAYAEIANTYKTSDFRFRLIWNTDADDNDYDGCFVDDIEIHEVGDGSGETYAYFSGTSMAAPHVAGAGALVKAYNPNLSVTQLKEVLLSTGDTLAVLADKVVSGKRLNIYQALNLFQPQVGYTAANIIPTAQIVQRNDGSGVVDLDFRLKDGISDVSATLNNFQYSSNGGSDWQAPTNLDESTALSVDWEANSYIFATDYSSTTYAFNFDSKSSDFAGLNAQEQADIQVRFKAFDGATSSPWCFSESFTVDNLASDAPDIISPAQATNSASSSIYFEGTATSSTFLYVKRSEDTVATFQVSSTTNIFSGYVPLENGPNLFSLLAIDDFGNLSPSATSSLITHDDSGPLLSVASVDADRISPYYTSSSSVSALIDGEVGMFCRWSTSTLDTYASMTETCSIDTATATCDFLINADDGEQGFYVACLDSLSNESDLVVNVTRDTIVPIVDFVTISSDLNSPGTTSIAITFQETSELDTGYSPSVWISGLNTDPYVLTNAYFSTSTWAGSFVLEDDDEVASGTIRLIGMRDIVGNEILASTSVGTISVDSVAPDAAVLTGLPDSSTYNTSASITVGGTDISNYKYKLDAGAYSADFSTTSVLSLTGLATGAHTVYVLGRDYAGNWQATSTDYTWSVLTTPSSSSGGGGGSSRASIEDVELPEEIVATTTEEEIINNYLSPDGTEVLYTYTNEYKGEVLDNTRVVARINQNEPPIDDLSVILDTQEVSQVNLLTVEIPSNLRNVWFSDLGQAIISLSMETKKASLEQATSEARQGLYMLGYDVFSINLSLDDLEVKDFSLPLFINLDVTGVSNYENLKLYYYDLNDGLWKKAGQGGRVEDGLLTAGVDHLTDFCLMSEASTLYVPFDDNESITETDTSNVESFLELERGFVGEVDYDLVNRLLGRIFLQVEANGEGWYLNPGDKLKYYLGRPVDAFALMRNLGIGISNENLARIAIADVNLSGLDTDGDGLSDMLEDSLGTDKAKQDSDGDGFGDKEELFSSYDSTFDDKLADKLKGKIFLQVEAHGEAWYVNPLDKKRYFLGRPADAFNVMKSLGLGISNSNLRKIGVGILN